jgi:hypothetical protein
MSKALSCFTESSRSNTWNLCGYTKLKTDVNIFLYFLCCYGNRVKGILDDVEDLAKYVGLSLNIDKY